MYMRASKANLMNLEVVGHYATHFTAWLLATTEVGTV
jgi:hypothetical protein